MPERQAVDTSVALVVCRPIVQEASDASALVSGQRMLPVPLKQPPTYPAAMSVDD